MPMSSAFIQRLSPLLPEVAAHFGTPFHLYDESGIRETGKTLKDAFAGVAGFREYFAVKALPNPHILAIMREMGFGFDCSSIPELLLSRQVGATGEDILFTSNNTTAEEFQAAQRNGGAILNLDDTSLLSKLDPAPALLSFRLTPRQLPFGNKIIGNPAEAKFGISETQLIDTYRRAQTLGIKRFGLHAMVASNDLNYRHMLQTVRLLLDKTNLLTEQLHIHLEFINMGGGLGIPYRPEDAALDIHTLGAEVGNMMRNHQSRYGFAPRLLMESGRYMTGSHGVLVTRVINRKETYRTYIGVDASMSALMRPAMYGAYHHIDIFGKTIEGSTETVDVVGALCENNDKFAIQRRLPRADIGDLMIIHDTGAHGHAMGFNYNGRLRPKELLLCVDGSVRLIRRAETVADYFATLDFAPEEFRIQH